MTKSNGSMKRKLEEENSDSDSSDSDVGPSLFATTTKRNVVTTQKTTSTKDETSVVSINNVDIDSLDSMNKLGISDWLCKSCDRVGIRIPSIVQRNCIPPSLQGKNIIGSAPTGSGKTASFALPILEKLAMDPFGIFAVVLTPTRELAMQITEQFNALGKPIGVRCCTVIGGMNMLKQSLELQQRPHIVVATPGRLADHAISAQPPKLSKVEFLVLDEADRLLELGFANDIQRIVSKFGTNKRRQTFLYSATMSQNLSKLRDLAATTEPPFEFHEKKNATTVETLRQEYMLVPINVKHAYLSYLLRRMGPVQDPETNKLIKNVVKKKRSKSSKKKKRDIIELPEYPNESRAKSLIIFTSSCRTCQLVAEMIECLGIPCVSLHAQLDQRRRLASLGKFRSNLCSILVATDVASRGLDIPEVDLVVNYDVPRLPSDYIHRVGRTARAGRLGRAITLITQHDVELIHAIEDAIEKKMEILPHINEDDILVLLTKASNAKQAAKMKLLDNGFEEQVALAKKRKRKQRKLARKFAEA